MTVLAAADAVVLELGFWEIFHFPGGSDRAASAAAGDLAFAQMERAMALLLYSSGLFAAGFVVLVASLGVRWHTARGRAKKLGWNCSPGCEYELVVAPTVEVSENPPLITCPECGVQSTRQQIWKHWMADEPL